MCYDNDKVSGCFRNGVRMLPKCCPDVTETLSGCFRNQCPDAAEIRIHVNGIANAIRKLGDLQLHGRFLGREIKKLTSLAGEAQPFVDAFIEYSRKRNIVEASISRNLCRLNGFFEYLQSTGVLNPCKITPLHISGYMASLTGYSKKTAEGEIYVLKTFFRAIYFGGLHFEDLSKAIPKFNFPQSDKIPTIWETADVEKLLAAVDRGSPLGKRDYAILLLVVRLGLRDGDVRNIKFENFKWRSNRVELIQSKTLQLVSLPLLPEIGDAVIDYLQHGRPQSDLQYVFLKHTAPYDNYQKTGNVVKKYIKIAKIPIDRTKAHGVHTLRHTLANNLLEHDVPLDIISGILGHMSTNSAKAYLHIDIENLRKCAIELGGQYE